MASAHGGQSGENQSQSSGENQSQPNEEKNTLSILVNGVEVVSTSNHLMPDGKAYASVEAYAALFDKTFELNEDTQSVHFNGKEITDVHMIKGVPTAWIRDLATAVGAQEISWDKESKEVYVLVLPEGTIQLEPIVVPAMGEHWANPKAGDLPTGPIYGVYNGCSNRC
jgi:hypothetical protein